MRTYSVRISNLGTNSAGNAEVRWRTDKRPHSRSFKSKPLADSFRAELLTAVRAGEAFDVTSGLPDSMLRKQRTGPSWFEHAVAYVDRKWRRLAPNSRTSIADALATITPALIGPTRGAPPKHLRDALYRWAFNPSRPADDRPPEVRAALEWISKASLPLAALGEDGDLVTRALDALAVKMNGQPAAANTVRRKRAVLYNVLRYAVERKHLTANPMDQVQWTLPRTVEEVDRRVVANPAQVRRLLAAVEAYGTDPDQPHQRRGQRGIGPLRQRGRHLKAFFGLLYFAAL